MRLIILIIFYFLCLSKIAFSQRKESTGISYLSLKDTILIQNIKYLIDREKDSPDTSSLFKKGYGYIRVAIEQNENSDTLKQYYLSPELSSIGKNAPQKAFPNFYTYVDNKLVVIYDTTALYPGGKTASETDKRNIRKLIDKSLPKPQSRTFYDMNGKKLFTDTAFRIDYFKLDAGVHIYILKNKSPVIVYEH